MLVEVLVILFTTISSALLATSIATKGIRRQPGSSLSPSSSYTSFQSALINSSYERVVSPYEFDGETVRVYLKIPSVVLYSLEENKQLVSYVATINITWIDARLAFDPEERGYNYTILPSSAVWLPTVFCYNRYPILFDNYLSSVDVHRMDTEKDTNEIMADGTVTLFQRAKFDTICTCDISQFPFDTQYCSMNFDTGLSAVDRQILIPEIQENYFKQGNAEWKIALTAVQSKIDECSGFKYSYAVMGFTLTRHSQFYIYFLIIPTFIVTSTCIAGVMLPSSMSTGEKMSTGVAGLLGLTFLLSIIVMEVPRAPKLPLLGKWVIGEMSFCAISIAVNAAGLQLNRFSENKKWLQKRHTLIDFIRFTAFLIVFSTNILFTIIILAARKHRQPPLQYDTM